MKLHLPKQLFTALLAAITLAAPATLSLGSSAWGTLGYIDEPTRGGDFYADDYSFVFVWDGSASGDIGSVLTFYRGGATNDTYGYNAWTLDTSTGVLTVGRGNAENTENDATGIGKDTTFTYATSDDNTDSYTFTTTIEAGVAYYVSVTGGDGAMTPTITKVTDAGTTETGASYSGDMTESQDNIVVASNSNYMVAADSIIWKSDSQSTLSTATNWTTVQGEAVSDVAGKNLIFDATSTVAKTVDISGSISVASIKVYDDYTFNATADATLTTTSGLTIASGKTLTLAGSADITLVSPVANNGTLALSNKARLQAEANRELGNVKLGTGSTLEIFNSGAGRVVDISGLTVSGTATIATWKDSTCHQGTINISDLVGSSATLVLKNGSQTSKTTLFNLGDSNTSTEYTGKIRLQGEAKNDSDRRVALNINDSDVAKGSVIEFYNDTYNKSALGLGASKVQVAGLNDVTTDGSNNESGTDNVNIYGYKVGGGASNFNRDTADTDQQARTLEITGSGTYKTKAVINGGVNITMSGTGTQTFTNTANLGKVTVSAGSLTFAGATTVSGDIDSSGSLTFAGATTTLSGDKLTVSSGTLSYEGTTDQKYKVLNTVVSSGATLKISDGDSIDYTSTPGMTMSVAGKLELGERQTLGEGFSLILSDGAEVTGGGSLGGLDFNGEGGSITSNGATYIKEKAIRLRSNDVRIDVQSGTLTTNTIVHNATSATGGIIKEGAGTLKITSMAQGGTNNGYQEVFFDGTTTLKAGTVEYALTEAGTYKGAITGTGNIKNSGSAAVTLEDVRDLTGTIEVASGTMTITELTNLQGALDIDGGTLNITTLNALKTISVSIANGGTLSLGAVVVDSDMQALDQVSDSSYYSVDGITSSDNGYLVRTGKYLLFDGYAWQGEDVGDDGYTVISDADAKKTYIEIESSKGSTFFVNTTLSSSDISGDAIAEQYHVNTDGSFTIAGDVTDGKTAAQLLTSTTGTGTLILSADNVSITESASTAFKGTLKIDGSGLLGDNYRTLTIGNGPAKTANIASLKEVQLVGQSKIQYHANPTSATDIQKLSVAENGKGWLYFEDSDGSEMRIGEVQLAASSEFTMSGKWQDSAITIGKLNGSGSFTYESPSESRQALTIDSLQGFEGELVLDNSAGHAGYSAIISTGTGNSVTFGSLKAEGSGTVFNVQSNTTVDTIAVASGVVNFSAGTKLTLLGDTASPSSIGTITADAGGNTIHLNETATLNRLAGISGGSITLTGSGTYDLGSSSTSNVSGLSDATWTGTVRMSSATNLGGINLNSYGNTQSTLELAGVSGWLTNGVTNVNLLLREHNISDEPNGFKITGTNANGTYTFKGKISGAGDLIIGNSNDGSGVRRFTFDGDLSEWEGCLILGLSTTANANNPTVNLLQAGTIFSGNDAGIRVNENHTGTLTVNIGNSTEGTTTMHGVITNLDEEGNAHGSIDLNVKGSTSFGQDVTVTSMTVDANKSATVNATLSAAATVTIGNSAELTLGGGSAEAKVSHTIGTLDAATGTVVLNSYATLTLGDGENASTHSIGTVTAGAESKINLTANATLNRISTGSVVLEGNGTYDFGDYDITAADGASTTCESYNAAINVTYGTGWEGTVKFGSGSTFNFMNLDLNAFANGGNSTIELAGVTGYLQKSTTATKTYEADFKLTGDGFTIGNGYGGSKYKFTGDFSGSGNLTVDRGLDGGLGFTFAGDMSGWSGELKHVQDNENKYIYEAAADVIDTSIGNKLTAAGSGEAHVMNVVVKTNRDVVMNGELRAKGGATMNVTKENAGNLSVKSVAVEGTGVVNVAGLGIRATKTDSATADTPASMTNGTLQCLKEEASFTIEDMTLVNTTITAATTTEVKLNNVTATNTMLAGSKNYTLSGLNAATVSAPVVGTGGSDAQAATASSNGSITYRTGLGVASGATLTLNLDVLGAVEQHGSGVYDITITLDGFGADYDFTQVALAGLVKFDADSWLGEVIGNVEPVVSIADDQQVSALSENVSSASTPSVSYTATPSVGTLVIVISGLNVPEPTTSTLSLLALAALAARRRRND